MPQQSDRHQPCLDELSIAAFRAHEGESDMVQAALEALHQGVSAAEVARITEVPYGRVLKWRRMEL